MINFFDATYNTEVPRKDSSFGVCDNGRLAYTTVDGDEDDWGGVVRNVNELELQFVPVDHNIVVRNKDGQEISQCDGMLYSTNNAIWLGFLELKDVRKRLGSKASEQLASTIQLFLDNPDHRAYRKRYAYVVNKSHPVFAASRKQEMQDFYNKYKFRLLYLREIIIKEKV